VAPRRRTPAQLPGPNGGGSSGKPRVGGRPEISREPGPTGPAAGWDFTFVTPVPSATAAPRRDRVRLESGTVPELRSHLRHSCSRAGGFRLAAAVRIPSIPGSRADSTLNAQIHGVVHPRRPGSARPQMIIVPPPEGSHAAARRCRPRLRRAGSNGGLSPLLVDAVASTDPERLPPNRSFGWREIGDN
jgi:hypothetical protein